MIFKRKNYCRYTAHVSPLWLAFLFAGIGFAQQISVPVNVQVPLFFKIISYNRNIAQLQGSKLVIGIIYQGRNRYSKNIKEEIEEYTSENPGTIATRSVEFVFLDVDKASIWSLLAKTAVHAVYITPLRAYDIDEITSVTRELKLLSITAVEDYVEKGISVGIGLKSDKPVILINLNACKNEGINFSAQLLKIAKLVE